MRTRKPIWFLGTVGLMIILNVIQVIGVLDKVILFREFALSLPLTIMVLLGGGYAILFVLFFVGLYRGRDWAQYWVGPLITAYAVMQLFWQAVAFRADYDRGKFGFLVLISFLALLPVWWICLRNGWLKRIFRNSEDTH